MPKIDITSAAATDIVTVNGQQVYPATAPPIPPVNDIQAAVNALPSGGVLQLPAGTYPGFTCANAQNNITVRAMGAVKFTGSIDAQRIKGFVLDGWAQGKPLINMQSFGVNLSSSDSCKVVGAIFTNTARNFGDNGMAIGLSDSVGAVIGNCTFSSAGGPLGQYNFNALNVEGNDFLNCNQVLSAVCYSGGNAIAFVNNYVSGQMRGGLESGGDPSNVMANFLISGNQFVDAAGQAFIGPVSYVAKQTCTGKILNNWFDRGALSSTHYPGVGTSPNGYWNDTSNGYSEAVELFSTATGGIEIGGNTFLNYKPGLCVHNYNDPLPNIHGNVSWNCQQQIIGISPLPSAPARPPRPPRMAWPR